MSAGDTDHPDHPDRLIVANACPLCGGSAVVSPDGHVGVYHEADDCTVDRHVEEEVVRRVVLALDGMCLACFFGHDHDDPEEVAP